MIPDFCPAMMTCFPPGSVRSTGDVPKSKSGPLSSGQLGLLGQPITKLSLGCTWLDHTSLPVSRSNARIASLVLISTSVYEFPVDAYTSLRFRSMVGDDQIAAPAGPCSCVPF